MSRFTSFPTIVDECRTVSIGFLRDNGYLEFGIIKSGIITWSRDGERRARIGIEVNSTGDNPVLNFSYTCDGQDVEYSVQFDLIPSNLGKGLVWSFICPITGERCRKLYLGGKYFAHRKALGNAMYSTQAESKKGRAWVRIFGRELLADIAYEKISKPYFKKFYGGKPTKRYLRIKQALQI